MSAIGLRGHQPRVIRFTTAAAPASAADARVTGAIPQPTSRLGIRNRSTVAAEVIRLYFLEEDYTANANFISIDANSEFDEPVEVKEFWLRSESGTPVCECLFMYRRG